MDRLLLSEALIDKWKIVGQQVGDKDISNHAPIWLKASNANWGPKPFKVNCYWFQHKDFLHFVEEEWKRLSVVGAQAVVMKKKFKQLRIILKCGTRRRLVG